MLWWTPQRIQKSERLLKHLKGSWIEKPKFPWSFDIRTQNFVVSLKAAYIEGSLPKQQLLECSDVIVWISTTSAALDQRQLQHYCLFSPAHRFTPVVFTRCERAGLHKNQMIKMALKTTRCCVYSVCTAFLLIATLGKSRWTVFITRSLLLCLFLQIVWYVFVYIYIVFIRFWPKSQQCSSMRNVRCRTYTTISQS